MKKLILAVVLLAGLAHAQTTAIATGTVKDLTGAAVTSGQVTFQLTPPLDTTISGVARFTPQTVTCGINGSGLIKNLALSGDCTVTKNTALVPDGTNYLVCMWPGYVKTSCFYWKARLDTEDITSVVPTPTTAPAYTYVDLFSNQTIGGDKVFSGNVDFQRTVDFLAATPFTVPSGSNPIANLFASGLDSIFKIKTANNYTVTAANPGAARAVNIVDPGGADDFLWRLATQTIGGKTINCATSGANDNTCTTRTLAYVIGGSCQNVTSAATFDLPTSQPATSSCTTGANATKGTTDFADGANALYAQLTILLPSDWGGSLDGKLVWAASVNAGAIKWQVQTACTNPNGSNADDPSWNAASAQTATVPGTINYPTTSSFTSINVAGCAAGYIMHVRLFRDPTDAADTAAGTGKAIGLELSYTRAF